MKKNLVDNFWSKVDIKGNSECWQWKGGTSRKGYGRFHPHPNFIIYAHRMAYILTFGEIPSGLTINHKCFNTSCCNPAHLEPMTLLENVRYSKRNGSGSGIRQLEKTHCPKGHPYNEENTHYVSTTGNRQCIICKREAKHRQRLKQRLLGLSSRNIPLHRHVKPLNYQTQLI